MLSRYLSFVCTVENVTIVSHSWKYLTYLSYVSHSEQYQVELTVFASWTMHPEEF